MAKSIESHWVLHSSEHPFGGVPFHGTLRAAKNRCTREFGGGFVDAVYWVQLHFMHQRPGEPAVAAKRTARNRRWWTHPDYA